MQTIVRGMWLSGILVGVLVPALAADLEPERFRPAWQVGQKWIVETVSRQSAARRDPPANAPAPRVRWQFEVQSVEKIEERDCYKVHVTCLAGTDKSPVTILWVDQQTITLRQVQAKLPIPTGSRTLVEMYRTSAGQAFPALAPLTVPPVELPVFQAGTKGTDTFHYEATTSPPGVKGLDEVSFAYTVEQRIAQPDEVQIKELLPDTYAKSLEKRATIEVRLAAGRSTVRQLWQRGVPWPVYSENGAVQARLIEVVSPPLPVEPRKGD